MTCYSSVFTPLQQGFQGLHIASLVGYVTRYKVKRFSIESHAVGSIGAVALACGRHSAAKKKTALLHVAMYAMVQQGCVLISLSCAYTEHICARCWSIARRAYGSMRMVENNTLTCYCPCQSGYVRRSRDSPLCDPSTPSLCWCQLRRHAAHCATEKRLCSAVYISRGSLCVRGGGWLSLDQPAEDAEDGVNGARDVVGVGEEGVDECGEFHGGTPCE